MSDADEASETTAQSALQSALSRGPALAMLDVADIPRAMLALDRLVKEAFVTIYGTGTVQPGRYLILFGGDVEATQRAMARALEAAAGALADAVLLPWAEERILPALMSGSVRWPAPGDTLGVFQNDASPTMLRAVDKALKGALVDLVQLRVGDGLGGKSVALLWGVDHDVEAAIELATEVARDALTRRGLDPMSFSTMAIRNADPEVLMAFRAGTTFFKEWRG